MGRDFFGSRLKPKPRSKRYHATWKDVRAAARGEQVDVTQKALASVAVHLRAKLNVLTARIRRAKKNLTVKE